MIFPFFLLSFFLPLCLCNDTKSKVAPPSTMGLQERVEQLLELSSRRPIIKLNNKLFKDLVRGSPRNYSMVVMFTALSSHRGCVVCKQASEEFTLVANSYRYSQSYSDKLFFALVDFDEGTEVFQSMGLNSAPAFIHFPAKGKPKKADNMDIQRVGFSAETIAKWIMERTEIIIRVFRPPNYTGTMALLTLFGMVGFLVYLRRNNLELLLNKNTWSVLAMFFVLSMISGQMWNHIRGPPFVHNSQSGGVAYIHGSSQGQFVLETYFVLGIYGMIVVGVILLCEAGDTKVDPGFRRIQAVAGLFLLAFFYSLILSIFRSKAGGYPYSFLFK